MDQTEAFFAISIRIISAPLILFSNQNYQERGSRKAGGLHQIIKIADDRNRPNARILKILVAFEQGLYEINFFYSHHLFK